MLLKIVVSIVITQKINSCLCFESTEGHRRSGWLRLWRGDHWWLQQRPAFPQTSSSPQVRLFQVLQGDRTLNVSLTLTSTIKFNCTDTRSHTLIWPSLSLCGLPLQVNLNKPCPFWMSQSHCGLRDCAVKPCSPVSSSFCLPCVTRLCSFTSYSTKTTPVYWQNEVPEGVRGTHYIKVSPSGAVYVKGTQPCNAVGLLGFQVWNLAYPYC